MKEKLRVALVIGTRPEILKMCPIIKELEKRQIEHKVYFTNQHFSKEMGQKFFDELGIKISDNYGKVFEMNKVTSWLVKKFKETQPDVILVQGDTNSTLAGALAGLQTKIRVGHIEAGLRSFNIKEPFPEEINRCIIDEISTFLFCPTLQNLKNVEYLVKYDTRGGYVVGNTLIDLVKSSIKKINIKKKQVLITLHRRENWDRLSQICKGIIKVAENMPEYEFIYVKHANKKISDEITSYFEPKGFTIIKPQNYINFLRLIRDSSLIISDSGGIVEEASFLYTPVAVVRKESERLEACDAYCARLVGTDETLYKEVLTLLKDFKKYDGKSPFGDGNTAKHIVQLLKQEIKK